MNFLHRTIKYILIAIAITIIKPSTGITSPVNSDQITNEQNLFVYYNGISLVSREAQSLPKKNLALEKDYYGRLTGTGITIYRYDGKEAYYRSLKFTKKINILPKQNQQTWIKVKGKAYEQINNNLKDNIIDVDDYETIVVETDVITKIVDETCEYVENNLQNIDLNEYKKTQRFMTALKDLANKDLNQIEYLSIKKIVFKDYDRNYIGIHCGKSIMRKNLQRGDFLSYLAIYNMNNNSLEKIIVRNTGYFLE